MEPNTNKKVALRIMVIYVLAGALWILLSDKLVAALVSDNDTITFVSMIKGWVYVAGSGFLIFTLVNNAFKRLQTAENQLLKSNSQLVKAKDEITSAYQQVTESEALLRQQYDEILHAQNKLLEYKQKLHELAYFDQLTGIPNKISLKDNLEELLALEEKCALLYVDLDNFKYINDTMGHTFGDLLVKAISDMVAGMLDPNCILYRLGGDKFILLIKEFKDIYDIERIAVKLLKGLKNPVDVEGRIFYNTASIGISLFPDHGNSMDELLKNADIALIKAKETGKNRIVIYSEPLNMAVREWVDIEKYLRTALENSEFELYYQPQYDMKTREISGFEALIRWRNDEMGFIMPSKFIKVAEDTHLIISIGEWVVRNACIFLKRLQQEGYEDITVSVNISMLQLLQTDFVNVILETLEMTNVSPNKLEVEITESLLSENFEAITEKMNILKENGVRIALDDFGKGYSSLNYLRKLPISTLKIDKSFIDIISDNEDSRILTDYIVKIAKSLNLRIVAEGVETQDQFDYLAGLNCDKMQGYLFSRPLTERDAIAKLPVKNPGA